jgi:NTE family protein
MIQPINLVLSGGGARGIAHLGVIKALTEYNVPIKAIAGVSAGAIAGAFYGKGYTPEEMLEIAIENAYINLRSARRFSLGLFSKNNMQRVLEKHFPENTFTGLKVSLFIYVTNINTGQSEYFSSGEIIKPLMASSALPLIFPPIEMNGQQYLDGGLVNNLPAEIFADEELPIVGVHVNPIAHRTHFSSSLRIVERSIELSVYKNIRPRKHYCNLFIEPPDLRQFSIFEFEKAREIFKMGYDFTRKTLDTSISVLEINARPESGFVSFFKKVFGDS